MPRSKGGGGSQDEYRPKTRASEHAREIQCPFFRRHSVVEIRCEGIIEESRTCVLFDRREDKTQHQRIYCEARWECCEIARMLMEAKYTDD